MSTGNQYPGMPNLYTRAEMNLIVIVFMHQKKAPVDVDWTSVAAKYGYKDGPLARQKFLAIMNKYKIETGPRTSGESALATTPIPRGRKRKADTAATHEAAESGRMAKRANKTKATKTTKTAKATKEAGDEADDEKSVKEEVLS